MLNCFRYSDSKQTFCVGGWHKSNAIDTVNKKRPKTKKFLKLERENVVFVNDVNYKFSLSI